MRTLSACLFHCNYAKKSVRKTNATDADSEDTNRKTCESDNADKDINDDNRKTDTTHTDNEGGDDDNNANDER